MCIRDRSNIQYLIFDIGPFLFFFWGGPNLKLLKLSPPHVRTFDYGLNIYLELHHRCWRDQCDPFVRLGPLTKWWSVWTTLIPVRFSEIIQKTKLINLMIFFYYRKSFSCFKQVRSNIWRSQWVEKKFREETNWTHNNWKILWWTWKWFPKVCSLYLSLIFYKTHVYK